MTLTGAKNSVLKLMAAALLAPGTSTITNVPDILDVEIMAELLRRLGCVVVHDLASSTVHITVPDEPDHRADYDLVRRMRASICVLGPLVARVRAADVALPGGDNIGSRGLDMHVDGLRRMGATSRASTATCWPRRPTASRARASGWTSRASEPPRPFSWLPFWRAARASSTTRRASRRSSTSA